MLDRVLWICAVLGLVYFLQCSKPVAPFRWILWKLGSRFGDRGRKCVVWLYCPRCASPWVGALLGWWILGHAAPYDLILDALVALGVTTVLVTSRYFSTTVDMWIDDWYQPKSDGAEIEPPTTP